jgi:hypothetical protein
MHLFFIFLWLSHLLSWLTDDYLEIIVLNEGKIFFLTSRNSLN